MTVVFSLSERKLRHKLNSLRSSGEQVARSSGWVGEKAFALARIPRDSRKRDSYSPTVWGGKRFMIAGAWRRSPGSRAIARQKKASGIFSRALPVAEAIENQVAVVRALAEIAARSATAGAGDMPDKSLIAS